MSDVTPRILLKDFSPADLDLYARWFSDSHLRQHLEVPTEEWADYVFGDSIGQAWSSWEEGAFVAVLQADWENSEAALSLAVNPGARGRGIGQATVRTWLKGPGTRFTAVSAFIDKTNAASLACFARCGFTAVSTEPDEFDQIHVRRLVPADGRRHSV